jgi:hypothetical protein
MSVRANQLAGSEKKAFECQKYGKTSTQDYDPAIGDPTTQNHKGETKHKYKHASEKIAKPLQLHISNRTKRGSQIFVVRTIIG